MAKILEKIIEPEEIFTGSIFKIRIKIEEPIYKHYSDYIENTYNELINLTYIQLREGI